MDSRDDERELQRLLGSEPPPEAYECDFCDARAYRLLPAKEMNLRIPQDVDREPVPVCRDCWPPDLLDQDDCEECTAGNYCVDHVTPEEWVEIMGWLHETTRGDET